ncbi:energy transducer TonB family protein [Xanthocytophaga flava]|uniref:energy transducer TonB family protein n=1 Tax=Xanthocytophaga flava TaxID=3048013 RepID=UPI0028D4E021|nr:energy transducer TonB [Xanthocytophaga flavus]MDJ1469231.1 energy transducer TonB [Xanthocytophaga flavus]
MKNSLITLLLLLLSGVVFSNDLSYTVHGRYIRFIKKERVKDAPDMVYPISWITRNVSVEITTPDDGKPRKDVHPNDSMRTDQRYIPNWINLGTDIVIDVANTYTNSIHNTSAGKVIEMNLMHSSSTEVPAIEAHYVGGYQQMTAYVNRNVMYRISETVLKQLQSVVVAFTVNEKGDITNAKVSKTCGKPEIDKLLLDTITQMPKWKPAQNAKGIKVKQDFTCRIGKPTGC